MSAKSSKNDIEGMKKIYSSAAGASLFFALPASAFLMSCSLPVVSVFFVRNSFTYDDAVLTSQALFYACLGLSAIALVRVTMPLFYAVKNTRIPVFTSFISLLVNASAGFFLIKTDLRHAGLTLAVSLAALAQILTAFIFMRSRFGRGLLLPVLISFLKMAAASALLGIVLYHIQAKIDWKNTAFIDRMMYLGGLFCAGSLIYAASCFMLRIKEINYLAALIKKIKRRFL